MSPSPLLSFLITLLLAAAVCTHGLEPVKDTDGNKVRIGEQYFIQLVNTESSGGLIPAATLNLTNCVVDIIQAPNQPGVPVSFEFPPTLIPLPPSPFVVTNAYITIEFKFTSNVCKDFPKFWEVHELPHYFKNKAAIYIGGNPWEQNSRFMIEKLGEEVETNIYKLTTPSGTVGASPGSRDGALELVLAAHKDQIILVKFNKVNDATTAATSTSRVEKLGLRMFPFY